MQTHYFTRSPRNVTEKINRRLCAIKPPMRIGYDQRNHCYWIDFYTLPDDPDKRRAAIGPIYITDLLPLARFLNAHRPAERFKAYAIQDGKGEVIPEGKLRRALRLDFLNPSLVKTEELLRHKNRPDEWRPASWDESRVEPAEEEPEVPPDVDDWLEKVNTGQQPVQT